MLCYIDVYAQFEEFDEEEGEGYELWYLGLGVNPLLGYVVLSEVSWNKMVYDSLITIDNVYGVWPAAGGIR